MKFNKTLLGAASALALILSAPAANADLTGVAGYSVFRKHVSREVDIGRATGALDRKIRQRSVRDRERQRVRVAAGRAAGGASGQALDTEREVAER